MKIQYLSDLHLESCAFTLKVHPDADVLVLAGDICTTKTLNSLRKLLTETMGKPTIYLFGNHEFYGNRMEDAKKQIGDVCKEFSNVHLLDDSSVVINGVLFVGSTLWSDFKLPLTNFRGKLESNRHLAFELASHGIADFHNIAHKGVMFRPDMAAELHEQARSTIQKTTADRGFRCVVCTHFLPSPLSLDPQFKNSPLNPYFASNCEDLMGGNVKAWIHGHTHSSCAYQVNGTQVGCNPRGYKNGENPKFDSQALITV